MSGSQRYGADGEGVAPEDSRFKARLHAVEQQACISCRVFWSDPNRVVLATTDSNVWGGASGHTYTFTRQPNGTTDIDVVVVREGKNLKGRLLGFLVATIGRRVLEKAFANSVKAIEARNAAAKERTV